MSEVYDNKKIMSTVFCYCVKLSQSTGSRKQIGQHESIYLNSLLLLTPDRGVF